MSAGSKAASLSLARMARRDPCLRDALRHLRRGDPEAREVLEAIGEDLPSGVRLCEEEDELDFSSLVLDDEEDANG